MGGGGPQTSTGRGGAGNIQPADKTAVVEESSLHTPTIKGETYTTGRGGSGNMTKNESAENARLAQDVEAPPSVKKDVEGSFHTGRGGAANIVKSDDEKKRSGSKERMGGLVDKGKEMLGLKK